MRGHLIPITGGAAPLFPAFEGLVEEAEVGIEDVAEEVEGELDLEDAAPGVAVGLDAEVVYAAAAGDAGFGVRLDDLQAGGAVGGEPRGKEFLLGVGVAVRVVADRGAGIDVEPLQFIPLQSAQS